MKSVVLKHHHSAVVHSWPDPFENVLGRLLGVHVDVTKTEASVRDSHAGFLGKDTAQQFEIRNPELLQPRGHLFRSGIAQLPLGVVGIASSDLHQPGKAIATKQLGPGINGT